MLALKKQQERPDVWHTPVVLALLRQSQKDKEFKVILSFVVKERKEEGRKSERASEPGVMVE